MRRLWSPPAFLLAVNVLCAVFSLVQTLLAATWLGVAGYGVVGLVSGVGLLVFGLFDLRLTEACTKLFYDARKTSPEDPRLAAGILQLCLVATVATAAVAGVVMAVVATVALPWFTAAAEVRWEWTALAGLGFALAFMVTTLLGLQRLTQAFIAAGWWRLGGQTLASGLFVLLLWGDHTLAGYFGALSAAALLNMTVALTGLWWLMRRHASVALFDRGGLRDAIRQARAHRRLVLFGGAYGWVKMLNRGADILVFGWFASDAQTGVYRLARALADALAIFADSLGQYTFPVFMRQMAADPLAVARRLAPRLLTVGLAVALTAAVGFLAVVPLLTRWVLGDDFMPAAQVAAVMSIATFWTIGVHLWLWPMLYTTPGRRRDFVVLAALAACLQLTVTAVLAWDHATAMDAGVGMAVYYTVLYAPALLRLVRCRWPTPRACR